MHSPLLCAFLPDLNPHRLPHFLDSLLEIIVKILNFSLCSLLSNCNLCSFCIHVREMVRMNTCIPERDSDLDLCVIFNGDPVHRPN